MTVASIQTIAVVSPLGGSGRTTLAVHLATLLAERATPCLAIDLCAQNMLGRHLGMQKATDAGWAALAAQQQWWGPAALRNSDGVDLLPFGAATTSELEILKREWALTPRWLRDRLDALDMPQGTTVLLDTPQWPAPLACQALSSAHIVLIVLEPSARACHAQPLVAQALAQAPADAQCAVVINRVDPRRPSQRSALEALRTQWGNLLLPYLVHEDENITQACEHATSVTKYTPRSQSAHDLQGIGQWLFEQLPTQQQRSLIP
jgi:cellulose synthase operon protein YhjQ